MSVIKGVAKILMKRLEKNNRESINAECYFQSRKTKGTYGLESFEFVSNCSCLEMVPFPPLKVRLILNRLKFSGNTVTI